MYISYKEIQIALANTGFLRRIFVSLMFERSFVFILIIICCCNTIFNYFSDQVFEIQSVWQSYLALFYIFLFFILIIGIIEEIMLQDFKYKTKEQKLKIIKILFYVEQCLYLMIIGSWIGISDDLLGKNIDYLKILKILGQYFIITTVIGTIISRFSYKNFEEEILNKGLLDS